MQATPTKSARASGLSTTIIPGFLMRGGAPLASFGLIGGSIQAQGHVQMACRVADFDQNPQAAIDAPRWRVADDNRAVPG